MSLLSDLLDEHSPSLTAVRLADARPAGDWRAIAGEVDNNSFEYISAISCNQKGQWCAGQFRSFQAHDIRCHLGGDSVPGTAPVAPPPAGIGPGTIFRLAVQICDLKYSFESMVIHADFLGGELGIEWC